MGMFNDEINVIFNGSGERGPPGIEFALTSSGDFDINKKRLTNVGSPKEVSDSTTKEYVDLNDMYRSAHTKNEFLLTAGNFNTSSSLTLFVFGKYTDFSRIYHNAPSHIICALSQSPAMITINLGKIQHGVYGFRVEAITNPKDNSDQLDIIVNHSGSTKTTTFKEKLEQNVCITDTRLVVENDLDVIMLLTLNYIVGKEIAIFISGRRGEGHVDPLIQENLPYGEIIRIPRYKSLETGERRGQIIVTGTFDDTSKYPKKNLVSVGNRLFKFINEIQGNGTNYFQFVFPCLIFLSGITLRQKFVKDLGEWQIKFFNENKGTWDRLIDDFLWNDKQVDVTNMNEKVSRLFRLVQLTGKTNTETGILPIKFTTKALTVLDN